MILQYNGKTLAEGATEEIDAVLSCLTDEKFNKRFENVSCTLEPYYDSFSITRLGEGPTYKVKQRIEVTIKLIIEDKEYR